MREYYKTLSGFGGTGNDPAVNGYLPVAPDVPAYGVPSQTSPQYSGFGGYGNDPSVGSMGGFSLGDNFNSALSDFKGMNWIGTQKDPGILPTGLGIGQNLLNTWLGMQQYGLAKKGFDESQRRYNQDFAVQKGLVNERLHTRATGSASARGFSNNSADSQRMVADHLAKYGVK
jgi:hypothetical protein